MNPTPLRDERLTGGTQLKPSADRNRIALKHAVIAVVSLGLYVLLNRSDVIVETQLGSTVWYPPGGLALALILGVNPWYALLVAFGDALSGALIYHQPWASWTTMLGSPGLAAMYAGAAIILRGPLRIDQGLNHRRDVTRYVLVTSITAICATVVGVGCLVADNSIPWNQAAGAALNWFSGDAIAFVGVTPFLLIHVLPPIRRWLSLEATRSTPTTPKPRARAGIRLANLGEALGQGASILLVLWIMFVPLLAPVQLFYLSFIPVIWVAMRHGIRRVTSAILAFDFGVAVAVHLYPTSQAMLPKVGLLMFVVSFTGLILGSAVSERQRIAEELRDQTTNLNSLIESTPLGVVVLDTDGRVKLCNDAFENLFLFPREELIGTDLEARIFPPGADSAAEISQVRGQLALGQRAHYTSRRVRKDGQSVDVDVYTVPLEVSGEVRGCFAIYRDIFEQIQAQQQTKQHTESLARLVNELQLRSTEMKLLNEMGDLLQCCANAEEAYLVVATSVRKLLPTATAGVLYIFKPSRNAVDAAATWGQSRVSEPGFAPTACWGLRRGQPHWSEYPGAGLVCQHLKLPIPGKYLCVPMVGQGETLGVLHLEFAVDADLESDRAPKSAQESLQRLATTVAGQIALSLASLQLRETLRDQSIRDSLTGLFNRRFMEESLDRELQRARRKKRSLAVLFLDLDHFKRFNDAFGHDAGDTVLRRIAEVFREHFRGDDVVCRYGGEEFAIILPESNATNAARRADLLRAEARKIEIRHQGQILNAVTFSVGVASFPENGSTGEEILRAADQSLYQSKAGGRDRVTVAVPQVMPA
jgi:diguanylate cyclase (GGDEF)-like protein/PAS domain S-box-containing protein